MRRRKYLLLAAVFVLAVTLRVDRLYFPIVGPRSARELVASFSGLPLPFFVQNEGAMDQCSGMLCQDYHARALVRIPKRSCARVLVDARAVGYRELPLPDGISPPYETGQAPIPQHGLFRYLKPRPQETRFSWIDADSCRVYVEFIID